MYRCFSSQQQPFSSLVRLELLTLLPFGIGLLWGTLVSSRLAFQNSVVISHWPLFALWSWMLALHALTCTGPRRRRCSGDPARALGHPLISRTFQSFTITRTSRITIASQWPPFEEVFPVEKLSFDAHHTSYHNTPMAPHCFFVDMSHVETPSPQNVTFNQQQ